MTPPGEGRPAEIDWEAARRRLAELGQALEDTQQLSAERARALLEQRARHLAGVADSEDGAREELEVVTFALSNERYALESRYVLEVVPLADFTPVPGAPGFLLGVTNLRGEIVAIFDLRELLGLSQRSISDLFRVIVLGSERPEFGIVADAVDEVTTLVAGALLDPPAERVGCAYVRGVTKEALILLDGAALSRDPGLFVDQRDV